MGRKKTKASKGAAGPTYVVKFRRRRQGKTDYNKRLQYLKSGMPRLIIRISNKHCLCQVIRYSRSGDVTSAVARSIELKGYGYSGNTGNRKAAYLTGYLCGKRSHDRKLILDMGLQHPHPQGRLYSALRGAIDAGVIIPHDESILPPDNLFGELAPVREKIDKSPGKIEKKKKEAAPKKAKTTAKKPKPKKESKSRKKVK